MEPSAPSPASAAFPEGRAAGTQRRDRLSAGSFREPQEQPLYRNPPAIGLRGSAAGGGDALPRTEPAAPREPQPPQAAPEGLAAPHLHGAPVLPRTGCEWKAVRLRFSLDRDYPDFHPYLPHVPI